MCGLQYLLSWLFTKLLDFPDNIFEVMFKIENFKLFQNPTVSLIQKFYFFLKEPREPQIGFT